jgi:hypothetical protein
MFNGPSCSLICLAPRPSSNRSAKMVPEDRDSLIREASRCKYPFHLVSWYQLSRRHGGGLGYPLKNNFYTFEGRPWKLNLLLQLVILPVLNIPRANVHYIIFVASARATLTVWPLDPLRAPACPPNAAALKIHTATRRRSYTPLHAWKVAALFPTIVSWSNK